MANNSTLDPLSIAYYCTGHGLGHATRSIEVCKHLVERGHSVTVVTGAPARVFLQEVPSARFVLRKAVLDAGSKQLDPFTVDVRGSLEDYYNTVVLHRTAMLEGEVQWLQSNHFDLVVSDVVPIVCAAAAAAGIPAVCVSNFSWGEPCRPSCMQCTPTLMCAAATTVFLPDMALSALHPAAIPGSGRPLFPCRRTSHRFAC